MSPHQSFPLWHNVPGKALDLVTASTKCYSMHIQASRSIHPSVVLPSSERTMKRVSGYSTAKHYATASIPHLVRSRWSCSRLHGSPPTYMLGLPPDKDVGCSSLLNLPTGRDDPPDKEIVYNCMNGSPGDPPSTFVHQFKTKKNRPFHNIAGFSTTLPCAGEFQSIFNHFLSTKNLSGKGTGSGTDARTCKQITVPK